MPEREINPEGLKYLGVGFMKTGLTSLLYAFQALGYEARGKNFRMFRRFLKGDYQAVMDWYDTADFFVDWPHAFMYRPFLAKYGDKARFILTVRDSEAWWRSLLSHNRYAHPVTHSHGKIFGRFYPHGFKEEHIAFYEAHNAEVRRFFAEQGREDQLLVQRVEDPDKHEKLLAFLGLPEGLEAYPHGNRSEKRVVRDPFDGFRLRYNRVVQPLYASWAPRLRPEPGPRLRPIAPEEAGLSAA